MKDNARTSEYCGRLRWLLVMGNLYGLRDWGHAKEYIRMLGGSVVP